MSSPARDNYRYLNLDGVWAGWELSGLELLPDGSLRLQSMPALSGPAVAPPAATPPDAPAGLAIADDGSLFFSDPDRNTINRIDPCVGGINSVPCLGPGEADDAGVSAPRGLHISAHRTDLFIADSRNSRILVVDPNTWTVVDVWGAAGELHTPVALAGDRAGNVYVACTGNGRVEKFARAGDRDPGFWMNVHASGLITAPLGVAASSEAGETRVFILDSASKTVAVFREDGTLAHPEPIADPVLESPFAIAAGGGELFVADHAARRIFVFKHGSAGYELVGAAPGFEGFATALALTSSGDLLALTAGVPKPVKLERETGFVTRGVLRSGAVSAANRDRSWRRLRALVQRPADARFQLFYRTAATPDLPPFDPGASEPFPASDGWRSVDANVDDAFVSGAPAKYFWAGAILTGEGQSSPVLSQMQVRFDDVGYLAHLPELYREEGSCGDFLERFLGLLESEFISAERKLDALAALVDPWAAPATALPWLAGFLGLEFAAGLAEAEQRRAIASAFERSASRGTARGLREAVRLATGVDVRIEEPISLTGWWSLPEESAVAGQSLLGFTTVLASANPQGAVVGATATLDQSHVIAQEDFGAPLFEGVAHQFSVLVAAADVKCAEKLQAVTAVVEREKPAHTMWHLCVIRPGTFQVGFQSRLGIETVLGGESEPAPLGSATGAGLVLGGRPAGTIGAATVGAGTWL